MASRRDYRRREFALEVAGYSYADTGGGAGTVVNAAGINVAAPAIQYDYDTPIVGGSYSITDFTFDLWMQIKTTLDVNHRFQFIMDFPTNAAVPFAIHMTGDNNFSPFTKINFNLAFNGSGGLGGFFVTPVPTTPFHYAITFDAGTNTATYFWNGVLLGTNVFPAPTLTGTAKNPHVETNATTGAMNLSVAHCRVSDGKLWTANFTPPSYFAAYTVTGATRFYCPFNEGTGKATDKVSGIVSQSNAGWNSFTL